jgi:hypothetical protein
MPSRQIPTLIQQQVNSDSIFFVHLSERPNSVNVAPQLNGLNYLAWIRSTRHALDAKNKLAFIYSSTTIFYSFDLN